MKPTTASSADSTVAAVDVRNLSKTYGRRGVQAVNDLSLKVFRGEIFGLLGPNGAGKSTLIKVLLGIVRPTSGTASVFGQPIGTPDTRLTIGYLPENHRFPEYLTARQMLQVYGRMAGVPDEVIEERTPGLLTLMKLEDWADVRIRKYSKGMMQRIGLAQAMINDPDLLFLDEPTDGVDPVGRKQIRDYLLYLREQGKTIFLNSHLLSEVEQVCTRVAILDHGKLVFDGALETIAGSGLTYELSCAPLPEPLLTRMDGFGCTPLENADDQIARYRIETGSLDTLNELIDVLRHNGITIHELTRSRQSLEEYFIDVVTAESHSVSEG